MKKIVFIRFTIVLLLFIFLLIDNANAQIKNGLLSKSKYSDPNNYFKIVPPNGWRVEKYPQDPRGKVAFIGPDGAELRILAKGLDYNSFKEMKHEIKDIEKKIGINTNIEEIMFSDVPAIKRQFILKGNKILFIDFMIGNATHNLMYTAPVNKFDEYLSVAQESMDTYEPSLEGVSSEDVKKHAVAKTLRLSNIFFEQGNYDLALEFINEGLNIEPNNPNLLELKNKIGSVDNSKVDGGKNVNSKEKDNSTDYIIFCIVLSIIGALCITFSQSIASGTVSPGIASISTPIIGAAMVYYGLIEGLFEGGHIFLGVLTALISLMIFALPLYFRIKKEEEEKQKVNG